ncbi:MAG TPA: glycosyltransferase [Desulfobulbaceae bacterium]|nr:glycosyltransferase [Desulfobulbaceae bacterium]
MVERKKIRILSIGSLRYAKGFDVLIRAMNLLKNKEQFGLLILCKGSLCDELHSQVKEMGLESCIKLGGFIHDPGPFYSIASLFVLSSRYEGFAGVLLEALSFGVPIISTDCKSRPAEILENGKWGKLVPVENPGLLAKAIDEALESNHASNALKERAKYFAPRVVAQRYLDLMA